VNEVNSLNITKNNASASLCKGDETSTFIESSYQSFPISQTNTPKSRAQILPGLLISTAADDKKHH